MVPGFAFSDIDDTELNLIASSLESMGVVNGYSDGSFSPNETLTRAQFAKLAVLAAGKESELTTSSNQSSFSDVSSSHWAVGYINIAQKYGYINGIGDGTFAPEAGVTLGQAVTVVLRLLEYTSSDIGSFWPADYTAAAENLGLLDNIDKGDYDIITRADACYLLFAMLNEETNSGTDYLKGIVSGTVSDVVILDNSASNGNDDDALQVMVGTSIAYYSKSYEVPDDLVMSARGTLLLDKTGDAIGFVPYNETRVYLTVSDVDANYLTDASNKRYEISSSASLVINDDYYNYVSAYYELENCNNVVLCYDDNGLVEMVIGGANISVSGYVLTGYFEDAYPSSANPSSVTLLGADFDVSPYLSGSFSSYDIGDKIMITLDEDGEVVKVNAYSYSQKQDMIGILNDDDTVTLTCGIVLDGTISGSGEIGELVYVTATSTGKFSATAVSSSNKSSLDVTARTIGGVSLDSAVQVYERVDESVVQKITYSSILIDTVPSSDIDYVHVNSSGDIDIILLNDVTGNLYDYGLIVAEDVSSKSSGSTLTAVNTMVSIENSYGETDSAVCATLKNYEDEAGGIIFNADGEIAKGILLESTGKIGRSDFIGTESIVYDGQTFPISDDVQVYNDQTETWTTLDTAKGFTSSFEAFYDKDADEGGQIRVIIAY